MKGLKFNYADLTSFLIRFCNMSLLKVEIFKLFKQRRTYYALVAVIFMEIIVFAIAYDQGAAILSALLDNLQETFFFEGNLLNGNLITYFLLNSLWFHLPLLLMLIVTGLITLEHQDGTLRSVFLQPVSKVQFLLSKYLTAMLFTGVIVLLLAITTFVFSYLLFGKGDLIVYFETLNFFESPEAFKRLAFGFASGTLTMLLFSSLSLTIAVFLKESIKTWIVAILVLICSNLIAQLHFDILGWDYWFFPRLLNTWQQFFYFEIPWDSLIWKHLILIGYTILFIILGLWRFTTTDVD